MPIDNKVAEAEETITTKCHYRLNPQEKIIKCEFYNSWSCYFLCDYAKGLKKIEREKEYMRKGGLYNQQTLA